MPGRTGRTHPENGPWRKARWACGHGGHRLLVSERKKAVSLRAIAVGIGLQLGLAFAF
jgi:hypothetical protein